MKIAEANSSQIDAMIATGMPTLYTTHKTMVVASNARDGTRLRACVIC